MINEAQFFRLVPCVDGSVLSRDLICFALLGRSCHVSGLLNAALFMAAGHNALRRLGPGQKHALFRRNGTSGLSRSVGRLAWVRYSISALSNLVVRENFPPVRFAALSCLWQRCPVFLVADHHGPGHAGDLVGQRNGGNLC